jgi:hypothetical protein
MDDATRPICTDKVTVGLDLGDKYVQICTLDCDVEVIEQARPRTTPVALRGRFASMPAARVVLEAGTHSPGIAYIQRYSCLARRVADRPSGGFCPPCANGGRRITQ